MRLATWPNAPISKSHDEADARDARTQVLRERIEIRRGDVVHPHQPGVGVEDVEDVQHQPYVRHAAAERPRNPEVCVPEVRIPERIDLGAEEDRNTGIA